MPFKTIAVVVLVVVVAAAWWYFRPTLEINWPH